jgi:hypothetical protein
MNICCVSKFGVAIPPGCVMPRHDTTSSIVRVCRATPWRGPLCYEIYLYLYPMLSIYIHEKKN